MESKEKVEVYVMKHEKWAKELSLLRETMVRLGLEETLKWGAPVYVQDGKNVVGLAGFKNHMALWFFHGSLLLDSENKLLNAQEGKTTAMRQWRFFNFEEIANNLELVERYIKEAMDNSSKGKQVKPNRNKPLIIPEELNVMLQEDVLLKIKFDSLSLSKRRDYAEHISDAKRAQTKQSRLDKILPMIMEGLGLHDKYKK